MVIDRVLSLQLSTKEFLNNLRKELIKSIKHQVFTSMLHVILLLDLFKPFMQIIHHQNTCIKIIRWNQFMLLQVSSICMKKLNTLISVSISKLMDMVQSFLMKISYWNFKHFCKTETSSLMHNLSRMTKISSKKLKNISNSFNFMSMHVN